MENISKNLQSFLGISPVQKEVNAGETQLVSFDQSNNSGSIDVKMDRSVLEEKSSFKMLALTFSSKLD